MTLSNKFGTRIAAFCLFVFALFFAVACSDDEPASLPSEAEDTPCRIAVVLHEIQRNCHRKRICL